jgi:hypothetical protein
LQRVAITTFAIFCCSAHAQPIGIGAMGDSLTDEYDLYTPAIYGSEGQNWIEQLARTRSLEMDFGTYSAANRGAPRYVGYAHNWARSGATTATLLSEGQHSGLAEQIANGDVSLVYLGIGANNFATIDVGTFNLPGLGPFAGNLKNEYGPIYHGQRADQQVANHVNELVSDFMTALDAVSSAGADVVVGTVFDLGATLEVRAAFPDAARRGRVTDAVMAANSQITDIALSRGLPVVDFNALVNLYHSSTPVLVGGIDTKLSGRFFLADRGHPSTLIQGLFANAFIAAANEAFGTNFTPLSAAEILMNAGISPPDPLGETFDATTLVTLPPTLMLPGDYNDNGVVDAADYVGWRNGLGTTYTQADYDVWRAHFGRAPSAGWSAGSGAVDPLSRVLTSVQSLSAAVPEPANGLLAVLAVVSSLIRRRPR